MSTCQITYPGKSLQGKYEILGNVNTSQNKKAHIEWVNAYLGEIKYK